MDRYDILLGKKLEPVKDSDKELRDAEIDAFKERAKELHEQISEAFSRNKGTVPLLEGELLERELLEQGLIRQRLEKERRERASKIKTFSNSSEIAIPLFEEEFEKKGIYNSFINTSPMPVIRSIKGRYKINSKI